MQLHSVARRWWVLHPQCKLHPPWRCTVGKSCALPALHPKQTMQCVHTKWNYTYIIRFIFASTHTHMHMHTHHACTHMGTRMNTHTKWTPVKGNWHALLLQVDNRHWSHFFVTDKQWQLATCHTITTITISLRNNVPSDFLSSKCHALEPHSLAWEWKSLPSCL